jgi:hypothetical protein
LLPPMRLATCLAESLHRESYRNMFAFVHNRLYWS